VVYSGEYNEKCENQEIKQLFIGSGSFEDSNAKEFDSNQ